MRQSEENDPSGDPPERRPPDLEEASTHLANERTFLAWIWTGMILMGSGVAIAKMRVTTANVSQVVNAGPQSTGAPEIGPVLMGVLFLVLGLLIIVMSAGRYFTVQDQLRKQAYQPSNTMVYLLFIGLIVSGFLLAVYVIDLR